MTTEVRALILSAAAALMLGVMGVAVSLATGSGAILLDGAFNLSFFVTALVTLRVARLLRRPDDRDYPFGYLHFEPLINTVKALLILAVGLVALIDAGVSLYRGGNEVSAGLALAYAAFATVFCGLLVLALRRARRQAPSPLVETDIENWVVNFAISVGMLAAFCVALFLQRAAWRSGPAGRPHARRPRRDPHARGADPHGPARAAGAAPARARRRKWSPRSRGWCAARSRTCRCARSTSASSSPGAPPTRWCTCCSARRPRLDVDRTDALRRAIVAAVAGRYPPPSSTSSSPPSPSSRHRPLASDGRQSS